MCQRVTCSRCGKANWRGCGQHVEQVLRGVPTESRCTCPRSAPGSGDTAGAGTGVTGLLARLLGR